MSTKRRILALATTAATAATLALPAGSATAAPPCDRSTNMSCGLVQDVLSYVDCVAAETLTAGKPQNCRFGSAAKRRQ